MLRASLCRLDFVDGLPDDVAKRLMVLWTNESLRNRSVLQSCRRFYKTGKIPIKLFEVRVFLGIVDRLAASFGFPAPSHQALRAATFAHNCDAMVLANYARINPAHVLIVFGFDAQRGKSLPSDPLQLLGSDTNVPAQMDHSNMASGDGFPQCPGARF